ncbi:hypothetical protein ILUMI_10374 [Ignelater luminosus]|uniref:Uncharacterized protein n=1 Tax=Ignelater luminosus TaxID=2038154 RepID=A0A8K0CY11_IGNLU|nr:hypothetical protein ILUMI_10374 [Ignelater luminosus]
MNIPLLLWLCFLIGVSLAIQYEILSEVSRPWIDFKENKTEQGIAVRHCNASCRKSSTGYVYGNGGQNFIDGLKRLLKGIAPADVQNEDVTGIRKPVGTNYRSLTDVKQDTDFKKMDSKQDNNKDHKTNKEEGDDDDDEEEEEEEEEMSSEHRKNTNAIYEALANYFSYALSYSLNEEEPKIGTNGAENV